MLELGEEGKKMRKRREKTGLRRFKWSCDGDALDRKGFDLSGEARACGMLSRLAHSPSLVPDPCICQIFVLLALGSILD